MISHKHKCIFLHVPKTGGTSIESALGHLDDHVGRGGQDHRSLRTLALPGWQSSAFSSFENSLEIARTVKYQLIRTGNPKNRIMLSREQYNEYFKFTVIRNPWSRAYSYYKGVMRNETNKRNLGITEELGFGEFLEIRKRKGLIRPQTYWLKDYSGAIPMDHICRFENLQTDFTEVCQRMGLEPIQLPHRMKGLGEDYRAKYDESTIQLIADAYREEIALFDFQYGD